MSVLNAVQVIALLSLGLKAGVLAGDQMGVRYARPGLPASSFVSFQQVQLARWERFMPALSALTVLACAGWLALTWSGAGGVAFTLVAIATLTSIASMTLAVKGCLPVVSQLMTWNAAAPPPDLMKIWARWEKVNAIRAALAVLGLLCAVIAVM